MPSIKAIYQQFKKDTHHYTPSLNLEGFFKIYPGQLALIASRPSIGKTTLMLYLVQQVLEHHQGDILFITNEESEDQLFLRLASQLTSIPMRNLDGMMNEALMILHKTIESNRIHIHHPNGSWEEYLLLIEERVAKQSIRYLFIDKLQGICTKQQGPQRTRELTTIASDLQNLAKKHQITVIATSAMSRSQERRPDKWPHLTDLDGPPALEECSEVVIALNRHEHYGIELDQDGNRIDGITNAHILKNRNGVCQEIEYHFDSAYPRVQPHKPENDSQSEREKWIN